MLRQVSWEEKSDSCKLEASSAHESKGDVDFAWQKLATRTVLVYLNHWSASTFSLTDPDPGPQFGIWAKAVCESRVGLVLQSSLEPFGAAILGCVVLKNACSVVHEIE